ncbi:MAG: pilus assembly protein TadG-related protein [Gammaproteobacteria bacterium]
MRDQTGKVIESVAACRQRGVVLPLVAVGMLAMLALAGLAMDASHALANKARMQNTADAAALAAAKTYDETADVVAGNAAALAIFGQNADGVGNHEMNVAFDGGEINIVIQWSQTLNPFVSTGVGPYVRVIATGLDVDASLSAIVGISEIPVGATAVAGPSPSIDNACNIAPLVVCANDPDDTDLFGFEANQLEVLKSSSGGTEEIGPGNYQLIRLDCPGGDCVRENLAGSWDGCLADDDIVETEPGNTVGPSVQGLNTRFNDYGGAGMNPEDYPPDVIIKQPQPPLQYDEENDAVTQGGAVVDETTIDYGWADYQADIVTRIRWSHDETVCQQSAKAAWRGDRGDRRRQPVAAVPGARDGGGDERLRRSHHADEVGTGGRATCRGQCNPRHDGHRPVAAGPGHAGTEPRRVRECYGDRYGEAVGFVRGERPGSGSWQ